MRTEFGGVTITTHKWIGIWFVVLPSRLLLLCYFTLLTPMVALIGGLVMPRMRDKKDPRVTVTVTAKCIGCGAIREIRAGEVAPDDVPICHVCGMPMIATKAKRAALRK